MNLQRKNKVIIYTVVIVLAAFIIFGAVVRCALLIKDDYEVQLKQNLADVSRQCAETVHTQLESRYDLLRSVNLRFELEGNNSRNILRIYEPVVDAFHLKRVAYYKVDGTVYATDKRDINLDYRYYFKKSMTGYVYISDILKDAISENDENVIVMSMPMRNKNRIIGVTGITYDADSLSEELAFKSFEGYGDNFVINQNGTVVVSSNQDLMHTGTSFIESEFEADDGRDEVISDFVLSVAGKMPTEGKLKIKNNNYLYSMTPVDIMDGNETWYVLSVVDDDYLHSRFMGTRRNLVRMICIVLIIVLASIAIIRYIFSSQKKEMYALAYKSPMTGGPNLEKFFDNMKLTRNVDGYIAYMNIEDFTHTSVAMGLEMTNEVVREIWTIISKNMKNGEFACHDKADSFVLYLKEKDSEELIDRLHRLRDLIHEKGHSLGIPWVYAKFGVCKIEDSKDIKLAYSKSEYSSYSNWGLKESVSFYNDEDHEKQSLNKSLEESFDDAIQEKQFVVWFQPKYGVSGEILTGAEALVRWSQYDGGLISPGIFIPLLEKSGEIAVLDEYVFDRVCAKQKEWKDKGLKIVPVSINLSRASLYRDRVIDIYMDIIDKYGLQASDIQLEVTESIVGENSKILQILTEFRERGIKILMDDFGTGYSSLSTLNLKVFDTLKIDKSLTDEINNDFGRIIMNQAIELGYSLGLHITVEGVETKEQLDILKNTKCNDIQGFYFSKPLPEDEYEKRL